jgi:uncharacterized membrane protein YkvA (DUF1232 family)
MLGRLRLFSQRPMQVAGSAVDSSSESGQHARRENPLKRKRSEREMAWQINRRLKNLLLFIPNMLLLTVRLMADPRVPAIDRALLGGAVVYAIIPFDLIPDMIPFVGQVDDAYLIALTLLRLMERTDPEVVREHWSGGGDVVELVGAAALVAGKFLPQRIRRVLTSRVEVVPGKLEDLKSLPKPLLVARPELEIVEGKDQKAAGRTGD